ncbi:MAG: NYN domain-containing protein [Eggerthellaceae bacterium]|nr:NYN domain-containing protein [Eggerthellaceae bacterium]
MRKRLLLVDGYNVLRSGYMYKRLSEGPDYTDEAFNTSRDLLINDVINYAGANTSAIIVFDGAQNALSEGKRQKIGNIEIIFTAHGQSADKVIEKLARDARERNVETMVVTSDSTIQDTVFGGGVDRMSANGFCLEVQDYYREVELDNTPKIAKKNTIAERIPKETLAKLIDLRDRK